METHSPLGVPSTQLRMWSHALLAALSALLAFLACKPGGNLSNLITPSCHMSSRCDDCRDCGLLAPLQSLDALLSHWKLPGVKDASLADA